MNGSSDRVERDLVGNRPGSSLHGFDGLGLEGWGIGN